MRATRFALVSLLFTLLFFSNTSCVVFVKHDNGKHKGWFKNSNNPHHPNTTNPGHTKKKSSDSGKKKESGKKTKGKS